ncbi:MAG: DUF2961 domain-containing protein [Acidobacteriaceae bacterium]|nr:DUF2961 domain-containing protein [Acidobacteriaceae bacterium]MBV9499713.1 DUF2961 domain-containing protein [Acidobacteriaceae bacterium]
MENPNAKRRRFLSSLTGAGAFLLGGSRSATARPETASTQPTDVPSYARLQNYQTLKQSSYDRTGGNRDFWHINPGETIDVFKADGPGIITHIWFTINAQSEHHLKELVLRMYWEGNEKPSAESPIGDFFGLTLGNYFLYQSALLNCSSVKALNAYFAMPYRRSARISVTNEGAHPVGSFYSNIDYQLVSALPSDAMYFHAQYRQATPTKPASPPTDTNLTGADNYVFFDTRGNGHAMGVTLGVVQNSENWFGEGDEMIFIDNDSKPVINGTGTEDYFCGAWDFGGGQYPFANLYNGAPYMVLPEHTAGRYCLYRWHLDNPIAFRKSLKFTIEHGHANDRADCFYSVGYWYQSEPFTDFPKLPPVSERIPALKLS